jgi:integrase
VANTKLSVALCDFERFQHARRLTPATVRQRVLVVRQLMAVTDDIYCDSVTPRHVDELFHAHDWSPRTLNTRLANLRVFFEFCRQRRYLRRDHDPTLGWRTVRPPQLDRLRIPVVEWPRLFACTRNPWEHVSLAVGLYLFVRASELKGIQLKHLHLSDSTVDIYRVKTKQWDTMPISSELDGHLRDHLTWLASHGFVDPEHFLLPARARQWERDPVTQQFLPGTQSIDPTRGLPSPWKEIQQVLQRAGYTIGPGEGMHTLRRSGARAYFDSLLTQGYDGALRRVQAMLGHANSTITEMYLGLNLDRQARNNDLAGQPMFPQLSTPTHLRAVR